MQTSMSCISKLVLISGTLVIGFSLIFVAVFYSENFDSFLNFFGQIRENQNYFFVNDDKVVPATLSQDKTSYKLIKDLHNLSKIKLLKNDPEMHMNASELITSKGLPCEIHHVQTADGFILGMQRIPHPSKTRPPVLLMHGLLSSSDCFLTNLVNESLAYILYNEGFDVWLGNVRGNTYSRSHIKYTIKDLKFWKWSFDEMGKYDIPVMVDYVLKQTGHSKLDYIGHSQGTTTLVSAAIIHGKQFSKKINQFVALAPAELIPHMTSPLHYLSYISNDIAAVYFLFGEGEFLPRQGFLEELADFFCPHHPKLCENVLFLIAGSDLTNTNRSRVPIYTAHNPAGTSMQNILHWSQMYKSNRMVFYDYGNCILNWLHYGSFFPPSYDLSLFNIKSNVFCGGKDTLVVLKDCQHLLSILPNVNKAVIIPTYNHFDFIWAINANRWVYNNIKKILKNKHK